MAVEVKTGGGRRSGEIIEDQMADYLVRRGTSRRREALLAMVDYYRDHTLSAPTMASVSKMGINAIRFSIGWGERGLLEAGSTRKASAH